jgi:hypothetical protein
METPAQAAETVADNSPTPNLEAIEREKQKPNKGGRPRKNPEGYSRGYSPKTPDNVAKENQDKAAEMAGRGAADMMMLFARTIGGEEWSPDPVQEGKPDEAENLRQAYATTFRFYGWCYTPGWFPLVAASVAYAVPRFNRPVTKTRLEKLREKYELWKAARKVKRSQVSANSTV